MLAATDTAWAPWFVADNNDKKRGRLNIISHMLSKIPYQEPPRTRPCPLLTAGASTHHGVVANYLRPDQTQGVGEGGEVESQVGHLGDRHGTSAEVNSALDSHLRYTAI